MKTSTKKLVVVEASRAEIFDLFMKLSESYKREMGPRFREIICAEPRVDPIFFEVEDWQKICRATGSSELFPRIDSEPAALAGASLT